MPPVTMQPPHCYAAPMLLATLAMFCRHCGYNLHGLPVNRSPECGHTFDPHDPKTYWRHAASLTRHRWAKRISVAVLTLLILATAAGISLWYPWHREQAAVRMMQRYTSYDTSLSTTTIGPRWLQWLLGKRGGFLLELVGEIGFSDPDVKYCAGITLRNGAGITSLFM